MKKAFTQDTICMLRDRQGALQNIAADILNTCDTPDIPTLSRAALFRALSYLDDARAAITDALNKDI